MEVFADHTSHDTCATRLMTPKLYEYAHTPPAATATPPLLLGRVRELTKTSMCTDGRRSEGGGFSNLVCPCVVFLSGTLCLLFSHD